MAAFQEGFIVACRVKRRYRTLCVGSFYLVWQRPLYRFYVQDLLDLQSD